MISALEGTTVYRTPVSPTPSPALWVTTALQALSMTPSTSVPRAPTIHCPPRAALRPVSCVTQAPTALGMDLVPQQETVAKAGSVLEGPQSPNHWCLVSFCPLLMTRSKSHIYY